MNYNEMFDMLANNVCRVVFTKKNGEERDMRCTRILDKIPPDMRPKGESEYSEEALRVFDLTAQGWRSFRVDSVKSFEAIL